MKKLLTTVAALLLFTFVSAQGAHAQGPFTTAGTWTFFVKINGAPPCQCIQLGNLKPDGTIEVPANDNFTGNGFGLWKQIGNGDVKVFTRHLGHKLAPRYISIQLDLIILNLNFAWTDCRIGRSWSRTDRCSGRCGRRRRPH